MNTIERHEQTKLMVREYESGDTLEVVARRYGMTPGDVKARLKQYGVVLRPGGRTRKRG